MPWIAGTRGLLIDVDGTLLHGGAALAGAPEAVARFRDAGLPLLFVTNTTRKPMAVVAAALHAAGIEATQAEVVAPSRLARRRILESGCPRAMLLVAEAAKSDFAEVVETADAPAWVVVGDLGTAFSYETLNAGFLALHRGARLLALHKNRSWSPGPEAGPLMDGGAFVAALEYAAAVDAEVVGKPSPAFWSLALAELGLAAASVVAVGDSVENDFLGAAAAGCRTALVRSGVFSEAALAKAGRRPDLVVEGVRDLVPA